VQLYYQIALLGKRDIGLAPDEYAGFTMTLLRMLAFMPTEKMTEKVPVKTATKPTENVQAAPAVEALKKTESEPINNIQNDATGHEHSSASLEANIHAAPEAANAGSASFDGNWRKLVEQNLKLGLARALAQNCELLSFDENSLNLRVASAQKHLISASYQDKLASAINEHFGRKIRLNIEVASELSAEIVTPAKQNASEKAVIQSGAEAAIMGDPFVQDLMQKFGATVIPNSIKPIQ
jgi:DNA polymerase III subunit gamma/tau